MKTKLLFCTAIAALAISGSGPIVSNAKAAGDIIIRFEDFSRPCADTLIPLMRCVRDCKMTGTDHSWCQSTTCADQAAAYTACLDEELEQVPETPSTTTPDAAGPIRR